MKGFVKILIKYLLPIVVIYIIFLVNFIAGLGSALILLAYLLYTRRAALCTFIGSICYSRGLTERALKWFKRSYDTKKSRPKSVVTYAYLLLKTGNLEEAELVLNKLLEKKNSQEDELNAKSNLALVYWKKGDLDSAVLTLQELIGDYKTSAVYGSLGYLLILKGDLDKALEFNLEAYDYNSTNTVILDNLGETYYLKGMYDKSLETYETLVARKPGFPEAYYNYALLLLKLDQTEKAVEMLKKALNSKFSYLSDLTSDLVSAKLNEVENALSS